MCKDRKKKLYNKIIFYNNPKANGKIPLGFCPGNQCDANFQVGLQKYIITSDVHLRKQIIEKKDAGDLIQIFFFLNQWYTQMNHSQ